MTEEVAQIAAGEPSAALEHAADGGLRAALESVVAISKDASDSAEATQDIVDRLVSDLELARARLFVLTNEEAGLGPTHLEPAATAGSHATLTREMPSVPLDGSTDVARVAESGIPDFHGDVHGLGDEPEGGHVGLGRWRSAVTTQSSAVIPLAVRDRLLGVLALEWSAPRAFDDPEREELMAIAAAAALVLDSFLAEERSSLPQAPAVGCTPGPTAELAVTAEGIVVPSGVSSSRASAPALALHVGASASGVETEEVFWDVLGLRGGAVALCLGLVLVPQGSASEVAETARHMLRAAALRGSGPATGLGLLAGWLAASGPGTAWVSALMLRIDVQQATAVWSAAGSTAFASRYTDGRFDVLAADSPPLGSSAPPELREHNAFLLPGDRFALVVGDVPELLTPHGMERLDLSLSAGAKPSAPLELLRSPMSAGGVISGQVMPRDASDPAA
jgi:hypothetical protein